MCCVGVPHYTKLDVLQGRALVRFSLVFSVLSHSEADLKTTNKRVDCSQLLFRSAVYVQVGVAAATDGC